MNTSRAILASGSLNRRTCRRPAERQRTCTDSLPVKLQNGGRSSKRPVSRCKRLHREVRVTPREVIANNLARGVRVPSPNFLSNPASGEAAMTGTTRFDAAEYLDTAERQAAYITAALEAGDPDFVRDALGIVARARGMAEIAK